MLKHLVAFDFDHTIVDENSDVVARKLLKHPAPRNSFKQGWTSYMQQIFDMLAEQRISQASIRNAIIKMKEVPGFCDLLEHLLLLKAEVIIISDSNSYFIDEWLKAKNINNKVRRVFTNPGEFEGNRLHITNYHHQDWCTLSSENLCKGSVLTDYIDERKAEGVAFDRIMYVGDGNNDYCPSLRLSEHDVTFPRKDFALMQKLNQLGDKSGVKAKIVPWKTHYDIIAFLDAPVVK